MKSIATSISYRHYGGAFLLFVVLMVVTGMGFAKKTVTYHDSWGNGMYRGANVSNYNLNVDDFRVLRSWGADHVRVQITGALPVVETANGATFSAESWKKLDAYIDQIRQAGLKVVVDFHQNRETFPPAKEGWSKPENITSWIDPARRQRLVTLWGEIAKHFAADRTEVLGYDILNEPNPPLNADGGKAWNEIVADVVRSIRHADTYHTIIIECPSFGNPDGMNWLQPVSDKAVVYSFHMYYPHRYTHQGVGNNPTPVNMTYPGLMKLDAGEPVMVDRAWLEHAMQPAIDFQQKTGARFYLGEFSAIRFAPNNSAAQYLDDVLSLSEAHGWSWCYHAFREWSGWDAEMPTEKDNTVRQTSTDRLDVLKRYFALAGKKK
ncbi:MAG TPA: cellulase family glycosylhydrolase [Armatimonadota bacterium]|nr:cellulase family glycosylhydrolase [Armatimonadota bacterium]